MENESRFETITGMLGRIEEPLRAAARVAGGRFHLMFGITNDGPTESYITHWFRPGLYGPEECVAVCHADEPDAVARIAAYARRRQLSSATMDDMRQKGEGT